MKRRQIIIIFSAIGIVVFSFFLSGYFAGQKKTPKKVVKAPTKKYVQTESVAYEAKDTYIEAYGRVQSAESMDLISEIAGRMRRGSVELKEGAKFRKGALLFRIDDVEATYTLRSQKSGFLRDLAAILPDMKIDYPDSYDMWLAYFQSIKLNEPLPEIPSKVTEKEKVFLASQNIYGNYYTIKSAETRLQKHKFYAPFSGTITEVTLKDGSFVNPGNKIGHIIQTNQSEIRLDLDVNDLQWISKGSEATIYNEDGSYSWTGRVVRIGDVVNPQTQSIDVYLRVSPGKVPLYDGLYLRAVIPGESIEAAMEIPRNALFDKRKVYTVQDSILVSKEVNVLKIYPESVLIAGLDAGEDVVVEPLFNAYNNMKAYRMADREKHLAEEKAAESDTSETVVSNESE